MQDQFTQLLATNNQCNLLNVKGEARSRPATPLDRNLRGEYILKIGKRLIMINKVEAFISNVAIPKGIGSLGEEAGEEVLEEDLVAQ